MAFSKNVRTNSLVAAARHCCVCHRYKGVKVEIHHILPLEQGGADTAENAIALCFDCHADAGHYNSKHPRGTKFSPAELRQAKDAWHLSVTQGNTGARDADDQLYCRYLVCKSFTALAEIVEGDLTHYPVNAPRLAKTAPGNFLAQLVRSHPESYRHSHVSGRLYASRAEYHAIHPDVRVLDNPEVHSYPYFEFSRVPSRQELHTEVLPRDSVTAALLDEGVSEIEIAEALAYEEFCGNGGFQEIYRLRPLWAIFLAATNTSSTLLHVHRLSGDAQAPEGLALRRLGGGVSPEAQEISLPRAPLPSGETILIPVATVLGPLPEVPIGSLRMELSDLPSGEVQQVDHADALPLEDSLSLIGPSFQPESFSIRAGSTEIQQEIHQFDLGNLYVLDRFWEIGCCPHVFIELEDSTLQYYGEVWSQSPDFIQTSNLIVPQAGASMIIAELEPETTSVHSIFVNSERVCANRTLLRGDHIRLPVRPGDSVTLVGCYHPDPCVAGRAADPWRKNSIVQQFLDASAT